MRSTPQSKDGALQLLEVEDFGIAGVEIFEPSDRLEPAFRKQMLHHAVGFVRRCVDVGAGVEPLDVLDEMRRDAEMLMGGIDAEHPQKRPRVKARSQTTKPAIAPSISATRHSLVPSAWRMNERWCS